MPFWDYKDGRVVAAICAYVGLACALLQVSAGQLRVFFRVRSISLAITVVLPAKARGPVGTAY